MEPGNRFSALWALGALGALTVLGTLVPEASVTTSGLAACQLLGLCLLGTALLPGMLAGSGLTRRQRGAAVAAGLAVSLAMFWLVSGTEQEPGPSVSLLAESGSH